LSLRQKYKACLTYTFITQKPVYIWSYGNIENADVSRELFLLLLAAVQKKG
jgi:hypothetical protein